MQERCVPQLLEEQRILIGGLGDLNQPPDHGGLLLTSCTLSLVASAILNERIAWVAVLRPRSHRPYISAKPCLWLGICGGSERAWFGCVGTKLGGAQGDMPGFYHKCATACL